MADANSTFTGCCQCGAVRYEAHGRPNLIANCHCTECQRSTGSGHATAAMFPAAAVKVEGERRTHSYVGESGKTVTQEFCPACGTTLLSKPDSMPGTVLIRLGTMDDSNGLEATATVFTKRRRSWDHAPVSGPEFPGMPPRPPSAAG